MLGVWQELQMEQKPFFSSMGLLRGMCHISACSGGKGFSQRSTLRLHQRTHGRRVTRKGRWRHHYRAWFKSLSCEAQVLWSTLKPTGNGFSVKLEVGWSRLTNHLPPITFLLHAFKSQPGFLRGQRAKAFSHHSSSVQCTFRSCSHLALCLSTFISILDSISYILDNSLVLVDVDSKISNLVNGLNMLLLCINRWIKFLTCRYWNQFLSDFCICCNMASPIYILLPVPNLAPSLPSAMHWNCPPLQLREIVDVLRNLPEGKEMGLAVEQWPSNLSAEYSSSCSSEPV